MRRQISVFFAVLFLLPAAYGAAADSAKAGADRTVAPKKAAAANPAVAQAREDQSFFREYVLLGNKAYADSSWDEACNYYKAAYALKPSVEVEILIQYCLERKEEIQAHEKSAVQRTTNASDGIAINVFNLSAAALAYFFYSDYAYKSAAYSEFEAGSTGLPDQRLAMLDLKDEMEGSRNTFVTMTCVAGASILYTAIDFLFIHAIFPDNVNTALVPDRQGMMLSVNTSF
jgi:hypothetical protein